MDLARRWLREELPLPDAFVCANDEMALGILEVLGEHGIRIPGDVRITGFDNVSSAELSIPRLSTVKRDNEKLDYFALARPLDFVSWDNYVVNQWASSDCRETAMAHALMRSVRHAPFWVMEAQSGSAVVVDRRGKLLGLESYHEDGRRSRRHHVRSQDHHRLPRRRLQA